MAAVYRERRFEAKFRSVLSGTYARIPCAQEQGILSAEQGIKSQEQGIWTAEQGTEKGTLRASSWRSITGLD